MKNKKLIRLKREAPSQKYLTVPASLITKKMDRYEKLMNIALLMRAARKTEIHPAQQGMVKALEKKVGRPLDDIIDDFLELEFMGVFEFSEDRKTIRLLEGDAPPMPISKLI